MESGNKRKIDSNDQDNNQIIKRLKTENGGEVVVHSSNSNNSLIPAGIPRTSSLEAPIMLLTGHQGEVYSAKFNPQGNVLASASYDKSVFLWDVYGECQNFMQLNRHKNAVLDIEWSHDGCYLYSSSTDKTCVIWDSETGEVVRKISGHTKIVNNASANRTGPHIILTGSDDCKAKIWDLRSKACVSTFDHPCPITSVSFNKETDEIFTAGLENVIKCWDLRKQQVTYKLNGHSNTITGIAVSPDGTQLLSNSMDNTLRTWDINPVPRTSNRQLHMFEGVYHDFENLLLRCSWSPDGSKISGGSSDKFVYIWNVTTKELLFRLPGHTGSVNEVSFHPKEPIIASCSSDKSIYLGELIDQIYGFQQSNLRKEFHEINSGDD